MRKLIMWNIVTLDGYFEGEKKWDLSFHDQVWGPELEKLSLEQLRSADYLIVGRVTYEGMAAYWKNAESENSEIARLMNSLPKLVFSTTLKPADLMAIGWNNATLATGGVPEEISRLKAQDGKNMYVFGSADLSRTLIENDLFDEYRIGIAPVILGNGTRLFKSGTPGTNLRLVSTLPLSPGGVVLRFEKKS
ncbi:MAG TPA: dihydrofolate reductase family protein [Cyclobacteriaceae bacterium]|jgi:dihydrofolate reductase|nr:MAG: riboflavin biosynthesis protein RibD [Bacteroidota bacterium]